MATPIDLVTKPIDLVTKPIDLVAKPIDLAAKPIDLVAKPVDLVAESVDLVAESIDLAPGTMDFSGPINRFRAKNSDFGAVVKRLLEQTFVELSHCPRHSEQFITFDLRVKWQR